MPCVCCPSGGDELAKLCRLGSRTAGAEERRSGTPRAVAVGEGSVGDWDRLAAFGHSVEDTPMAMEKVSSDPHGISNLTGLRCPANPEVGCCMFSAYQKHGFIPTLHPLHCMCQAIKALDKIDLTEEGVGL
ncbi:hypothetical protein NQZ68_037236 [Dissostichus eleginoides]|nr:hypothetical protein NQZ68_037236 [Dissostichus eleginoides]